MCGNIIIAVIEPPHLVDNPFFILELPKDCSAMDVERAGQKLLSMLSVGMTSAMIYKTPLGQRTRDADAVRRAMSNMRDPEKRKAFEVWVRDDIWQTVETRPGETWPQAHARLGTLDA